MNDFNKNTAFLDSNSTISFLNLQFTISRHIIQRASTTSTAKTFGETTRRARLRTNFKSRNQYLSKSITHLKKKELPGHSQMTFFLFIYDRKYYNTQIIQCSKRTY